MQVCAVSGVGVGVGSGNAGFQVLDSFVLCDFNFYSVIHCPDLKSEISTGLAMKNSTLSCRQPPPPHMPSLKQ